MTTITITNVPDELHTRLESAAQVEGRSIDEQALVILDQALPPIPPLSPIEPVKTLRPFTHEWLLDAIREGRE